MDFSTNYYYKLNVRFMSITGQWPFLEEKTRVFRVIIVSVTIVSYIFNLVARLFTSNWDTDILIENTPPIISLIICMVKLWTFHFSVERIREMLRRLGENWQTVKTQEEMKIMKQYAENGRIYSIMYALYIFGTCFLFLWTPIMPIILNHVSIMNESLARKQIFPCEYFIDGQRYFYPIYCHSAVSVVVGMIALVAGDTGLMMFMQHVCGMFAVTGHQLENAFGRSDERIQALPTTCQNNAYAANILQCVQSHRKAVEFANLVESAFSISLLIQLGLNIICLSITLLHTALLGNISADSVKFAAYATGQLFHLFCACYPGQLLYDRSLQLMQNAYNGQWYAASVRIQKLVLLIIRKTVNPSRLTAGKVYTFCLENFASVVQTSMSYFMVLSSIRS